MAKHIAARQPTRWIRGRSLCGYSIGRYAVAKVKEQVTCKICQRLAEQARVEHGQAPQGA